MNHALKSALEAHVPALAAAYTDMVTEQFDFLVGAFTSSMKGINNSSQSGVWCNTIRRLCRVANPVSGPRDIQRDGPVVYTLNDEVVAEAALEHARSTVLAWYDKIESKVGRLDLAQCLHLSGTRFAIIGVKGDNNVKIEQDVIMNKSAKGTFFNQYPSRLYLNGKFTSEADFKKLVVPK